MARSLAPGQHQAAITSLSGSNAIDGFIVRSAPNLTTPLLLGLIASISLAYVLIRRRLP